MDKPPVALHADFTITQTLQGWKTLIVVKTAPPARVPADNLPMIDLQTIQRAADRLQGQVLDTPCVESKTLSQIVGAQVFLKFEKPAVHRFFQGARGLQQAHAADASRMRPGRGGHERRQPCAGRGLPRAAPGLRAVIVMPRFTPGVKVERTRGFGAEVVLHGDTLEEARAHAYRGLPIPKG
jgi:threonine dehydratase